MEWDDIMVIFGYWQKFPPPGSLIRGIAQTLGIQFPEPVVNTTKHMTERDARALIARTGGRVTAADVG